MTNPIDRQSAAPDVFISSKEPADNKFGQNGYSGASSLTPGKSKPNIDKVSPPTAALPADRGLGAQDSISFVTKGGGEPVPVKLGMRHRGLDDAGSPGGTVPSKTTRR